MGLIDDLDRRREDQLRDRENSARLAQAYATFSTRGLGTIEFEKRVGFGLTFIERPMVSHAAYCDMEELMDDYYGGAEDADGNEYTAELPVCTGYVTEWDEDERGLFVGCWIAVRVYMPIDDWPDASEAPMPRIEHHFTFAGVAMKDLPFTREDATDD
jgi:hypothetical protein